MPPRTRLLVPTHLDREALRRVAPDLPEAMAVGFGPVAAAAAASVAAQALAGGGALLLVGIAGRYPGGPAVGEAVEFGRVALDGVGANGPSGLLTPAALGFPQWSDDAGDVGDALPLAGEGPELLTVCSAAGAARDVEARRARWPRAAAEDMEGFGVALAGRIAGIGVRVVRGISNEAGDRDLARWRIDEALAAAASIARGVLA